MRQKTTQTASNLSGETTNDARAIEIFCGVVAELVRLPSPLSSSGGCERVRMAGELVKAVGGENRMRDPGGLCWCTGAALQTESGTGGCVLVVADVVVG